MKKTILILLAGALLAVSSCSKQGDVGPTGPQGPAGPSGPGATEIDFTVSSTNWNNIGTSGTAGAHIYNYLQDASLAYSAVGNGTINIYWVNSGGSYSFLPYIYYNSGGTQFTQQFNWLDGKIDLQIYNSLNTFTTFTGDNTYKVVIIPGSGKTSWPVDMSDYNAVKAYFHPKMKN